jgi:hypothetical protein
LDGFPTTLTQAVLLEKALSGYDAAAAGDKILEPVNTGSKKSFSKSNLVSDPRPPPPPPPPVSGLDTVIILDLPDDLCLERAVHADENLSVHFIGKLSYSYRRLYLYQVTYCSILNLKLTSIMTSYHDFLTSVEFVIEMM